MNWPTAGRQGREGGGLQQGGSPTRDLKTPQVSWEKLALQRQRTWAGLAEGGGGGRGSSGEASGREGVPVARRVSLRRRHSAEWAARPKWKRCRNRR